MDNVSLHEQLDRAIEKILAPTGPVARADGFDKLDAKIGPLAAIASALEGLPTGEFKFRLKADLERSAQMASPAKSTAQSTEVDHPTHETRTPPVTRQPASNLNPIPAGYRTVTPYLTVRDVDSLLALIENAFGATITEKITTPRGGIHAEARIGDSMLMMGGAGAGAAGTARSAGEKTPFYPAALHVKVDDVDAVYAKALAAGLTSLQAPQDFDYGERGASVKDSNGNSWYIATPKSDSHYLPEMGNVTMYLHPRSSDEFIRFAERAFGATELMRAADPGGPVHHAKVRIGDSVVEMSDARPEYPASPVMIYMYVTDVDAWYSRALDAGATSNSVPSMMPYGDYVGSVDDPFGNRWYMSAHIRDHAPSQPNAPQPNAQKSQPSAPAAGAVSYIRKGFRTLTPYLIVPSAAAEIDFLKSALGAVEIFRVPGGKPGSVMHSEIRIGDSVVELSDATPEFPARASVNVLYVPDVDAAYAVAMNAGAHSLSAPADKPFRDRDAGFTGPGGAIWWISSRGPGEHITPDTPSLVPMFTVRDANHYIQFLKQAFGGEEAFAHRTPQGVVVHARVRMGDSIIAGGEAHGPHQSAPFLMHIYVSDTDAVYAGALAAGAKSIRGLEDAPYGDRTATVEDPAGNLWSIATHVRDVKF